MNITRAKNWICSGNFLYSRGLALILWFGLTAFTCLQRFIFHATLNNNFAIYRHVFFHVTHQQNLYAAYPAEYADVNLYGPIFSALIAPFAVLPQNIGAILWVFFNAAFLFFAIDQLPVSKKIRNAVLILSSIEMMNNAGWCQLNPVIAGCIILGFAYTHRGKDVWALFFIMFAAFLKIYGLAGLAFFFFSKTKPQYIFWGIFWSVVFLCLPMLYAPHSYILQCYNDWYHAIVDKSGHNVRSFAEGNGQDICVQGMIRRIFGLPLFNDMIVLIPALLLFASQYLRWKYFHDLRFRLYLLCSALVFTVIFSTGSEAPTYILAVPAISLWYILQPKNFWVNALFIFTLIFTIFGYSDIFTPYFRKQIVMPYSLKALPCLIIWLIIIHSIWTKKFLRAVTDKN